MHAFAVAGSVVCYVLELCGAEVVCRCKQAGKTGESAHCVVAGGVVVLRSRICTKLENFQLAPRC